MKKLLILFAITFIAVTLNAQFFIGGTFGISVEADRASYDKKVNTNNVVFGLDIAPRVGYAINDKLAVGLDVGVGPRITIHGKTEENKDISTSTAFQWGVYPFVRYAVIKVQKFSFILEGSIGVGGIHNSSKFDKKTHKGDYTILIRAFDVKPVLSYSFTDHWSFDVGIPFIGLGYDIGITKNPDDKKSTATKHNFNIGFNLERPVVTLGVTYKF